MKSYYLKTMHLEKPVKMRGEFIWKNQLKCKANFEEGEEEE